MPSETLGSITIGLSSAMIHKDKQLIAGIDLITRKMSRVMRKPTFWFSTWSDTNEAVQLQKMARGLKFWIKKVEGLSYQCRLIAIHS